MGDIIIIVLGMPIALIINLYSKRILPSIQTLYAGRLIVDDGTADAEARLKRVLWNYAGMGVLTHADAGYEPAKETAKKHQIVLVIRMKNNYSTI